MLWSPKPPMIPRITGNIILFVLFVLMVMNAISDVETIWINVLTNPLPMSTLMIFTLSWFIIVFMIYKIFSTALNHNQTRIQKKIRLLSLGSLFAKKRLFPPEYFIYSSAYAETR